MTSGNRVFVSYRSADGRDKATALARELAQPFGADRVFLDKDDLRGGSAWREEVQRTLGARPVLLLLLTPALLDATDDAGRRRIDDEDDPVRRELAAAFDAGAHVIPVLCDGVDAPPDARTLPPPFDRLAELTWRRLRAYDWAHDVQRLVDDLRALGVPPSTGTPSAAPIAGRRRVLVIGGAAAAAAGAAWWLRRAPRADDLGGDWQATLVRGEQVTLQLRLEGDALTLVSTAVPLEGRAEWEEYRRSWRDQHGTELRAVIYRGSGRLVRVPGEPVRIDVALQVLSLPEETAIDGGNLSGAVAPTGRRIEGRIWLNGEQRDWPAVLRRGGGGA
jgi:hypothetical protein